MMQSPERLVPYGRSRRAGFSLVEVLVTIAIVVALAVVVTPNIVGARDSERVITAERWLTDLRNAIHNPDMRRGSFRNDIGAYPGALEHLTREIQTSDWTSCGVSYTPGDVIPDKWQGSYLNRVVGPAGFPIGIGTVRNELTRDDPSTVKNSILRIYVDDVIIEDATALDERIDLSDGRASGAVQWGDQDAESFVTVEYLMNVRGC